MTPKSPNTPLPTSIREVIPFLIFSIRCDWPSTESDVVPYISSAACASSSDSSFASGASSSFASFASTWGCASTGCVGGAARQTFGPRRDKLDRHFGHRGLPDLGSTSARYTQFSELPGVSHPKCPDSLWHPPPTCSTSQDRMHRARGGKQGRSGNRSASTCAAPR